MVDNNDTLFREVEEELRREQFQKIWERYGTYIIGFAVLVVAVIAGLKAWEGQRLAAANVAGAEYEAASKMLQQGKTVDAQKAFTELANSGPSGYAQLARLSEAGALLKQGKNAEALAIFDKLSDDRGTDAMLASFARIQGASLRLGEADFAEMQNRLNPLLGENNKWRLIARELLGTAAYHAGKLDEARKELTPLLAEPRMRRTALERVNRLMAKIASAEISTTPNPAPATAPATTPAPAGDAEKPASSAP